MSDLGMSHAAAARAVGVDKKTIARWLQLRTAINVEAVIATPRLGDIFRRALCSHDHDQPSHASAPTIARKREYVTSKRSAKSRRGNG